MNLKLYTPEEMANLFAVKSKTIREWLKKGQLKGTKIGKQWRVKEQDLEEFLNHSTSSAGKMDFESYQWLNADLGGALPEYDWGTQGTPEGKPVFYIPGQGLMIED